MFAQVKTEHEAQRLLWKVAPKDVAFIYNRLMIFKVVCSESHVIAWQHVYNEQGSTAIDVLLVVYEMSSEWITNVIVADGAHALVKERQCDVTYTSEHMMPIKQAVTALRNALRLQRESTTPLISWNAHTFPFPESLYKNIIRSCAGNCTEKLKKVCQELCAARQSFPHPAVILQSCGACSPRRTFTDAVTAASGCVFDLMAKVPFLVAKLHVHIHRGCYYWHISDETMHRCVFLWCEQLASSQVLCRFITNTKIVGAKTPEEEYVQRINMAETHRAKFRQHLFSKHLGVPPPCISDLYKLPHEWNNGIRYQLAYIIVSIARELRIDVHQIAQPFVRYMSTHFHGKESKRRLRHFVTHLKRSHVEDVQPCITRAQYAGQNQKSISCPFGGGREGVKQCLAKRGVPFALHIEKLTVSRVWMLKVNK